MSNRAKFATAAAAVAVVIVAVMAFMFDGRGIAVESTDAPSPSPSVPAPTSTSPRPSATASGDPPVVVPGQFYVCIPPNRELRGGTDEQVAVPHPEGDMTIERQRGYTWTGSHDATDPRFSGTHYYSWDGDSYTLASGDEGPLVYAEGLRIENAEGAWQGEASGVTLPDGTSASGPVVLTGEGAYAGLTAVLLGIDGSCFIDFRGVVMEFPDPPVPSTTE